MTSPTKEARVVDRSEDGQEWAVRRARGAPPITTTKGKRSAIAVATAQLQAEPTGGELQIFFGDGRLESVRQIGSASGTSQPLLTEPPSVREVIHQIRTEGKTVDKGLTLGLAALGIPSVSALSAFISPEVQAAAGDGWIAVFFATLTWSLGCALAVVVVGKSGLAGWPLVVGVAIVFFVALGIAVLLGKGVLNIGMPTAPQNPAQTVLDFAAAAFRTYGFIGAVLGGGIGVWVGTRLSTLVPNGFMD